MIPLLGLTRTLSGSFAQHHREHMPIHAPTRNSPCIHIIALHLLEGFGIFSSIGSRGSKGCDSADVRLLNPTGFHERNVDTLLWEC